MRRFWPGALTLVLPRRADTPENFLPEYETIGVRMPDRMSCIELVSTFGRPITTTSANVSGESPIQGLEQVLAAFGDRAGDIRLMIDGGLLPQTAPSTVVGFKDGELRIFREGAISKEKIEELISKIPENL